MKTYKFFLVTAIIALGAVLSGCDKGGAPSLEDGNSIISNPFEESIGGDLTSESSSHDVSYGFGLHSDEAEFTENLLKIPMLLKGAESSVNVGVMVYVDGILQEYSAEQSGNNSVMNRFSTTVNEDKTIPIYTDAKFDSNLAKHTVNGISILYPDFRPEPDSPFFGNNHKALSGSSGYISIDGKSVSYAENIHILKAESPSIITSEQKEKYEIRENTWDTVSLLQSENDSHTFTLDDSESGLELDFAMYTTSSGNSDYRFSFYKNHTLTKFNGEYDYLDVKVEGGKIVEAKISIDDVEVGDFLYCVAVPLNSTHEYIYPIKTDSVMVIDSELNAGGTGGNSITDNQSSGSQNNNTSSVPNSTDPELNSGATGGNSISDNQSSDSQINSMGSALNSIQNLTVLRMFNNGIVYQSDDSVCYSENGTEIIKSAQIGSGSIVAAFSHEDVFSIINLELPSFKANGILLDKNLNVIKSVDLQKIMDENQIDTFDFIDLASDAIYFVDRNMRLCSRTWENGEVKVIATADSLGEPGIAFTSIKRANNYTAFSANKESNGTAVSYYGIIKDNGECKIYRKDGIASPQTIGNITLWSDAHVKPGVRSSGKVVLYKDGEFVTLKMQDPTESAYATLCDNGIVVTQLSNIVIKQDSNQKGAEIKVYDGNKIHRISISDYTFPAIPAVSYLDGNVITSVMDGNISKSISAEV